MAVVVFGADIIFKEKIRETAKQFGVPISFLRSEAELKKTLSSQDQHTIIFDLTKTSHLLPVLTENIKSYTGNTVGFYSHIETEIAKVATDSGVQQVLPKSRFVSLLPELVKNSRN